MSIPPASVALIALCACLPWLGGCDRTAPSPGEPTVQGAVPVASGVTAGSAGDPSVPDAASVFPSASVNSVDTVPATPGAELSATQESKGMPVPGQNNDHSSPAGAASSASAPPPGTGAR